MKNALLVLIGGLLMTGAAGASTLYINCGGASSTANGSGAAQILTTNISCPQLTVPTGQTLFDIVLYLQDDYSLGNALDGTNSWVFNWINIPAGFVASGAYSDTVSGGANSTTYTPSGGSYYQVGEMFSSFGAFLGSGTVPTATISTDNISGALVATFGHLDTNVFIQYDYGQSGVPEPVTLSLVGGGLLAVGLFARKRRKV